MKYNSVLSVDPADDCAAGITAAINRQTGAIRFTISGV